MSDRPEDFHEGAIVESREPDTVSGKDLARELGAPPFKVSKRPVPKVAAVWLTGVAVGVITWGAALLGTPVEIDTAAVTTVVVGALSFAGWLKE